jgi:hypothetical protein
MRRLSLIVIALSFAARVYAITPSEYLLAKAWPYDPKAKMSDAGRGVGIVFSPDLSVPGNCRFYQSLGFACFEEPDWDAVLNGIRTYNILYPERAIRTLVLETHGTNGNGLKLQNSYDPAADRSYISVGALQEHVEPDGVRYIIISACNSRRLLRPAIYRTLDPNNGDKLFLPATLGIINASNDWDPNRSGIVVATPATSHIEQTLAANVRELGPTARRALVVSARAQGIEPPSQFAVSEMFMEMLLRDSVLDLSTGEAIDQLSRDLTPESRGEMLYRAFVKYVNHLAARDYPAKKKTPAVKRAAKRPVSKSASARR